MGQYHLTVNLDKHEFLHPHKFGDGLKLLDQWGPAPGGITDALHLLLAVSNGRGGGDASSSGSPLIGSWGGDRIAVVGDYGERGDLKEKHHADSIYGRCGEPDEEDDFGDLPYFKDISEEIREVMAIEYEVIYYGTGRMGRTSIWEAFEGLESTYRGGPDGRIARFKGGTQYRVADIIAEAKSRLSCEARPLIKVETSQPVLSGR